MPNSRKSARRTAAARQTANRKSTGRVKKSNPSPRTGSKLAKVIQLLNRKEGVAVAELTSATKWLPHTARAALTGLRKRGFEIERIRSEGGSSHYRLVMAPKTASGKA